MHVNNLSDINMIIHHNQTPIAICKPDYFGMVGVFLAECYLNYPVGTSLEIEFVSRHGSSFPGEKIPMVVNNAKAKGTGLMLSNFEPEVIKNWQSILNEIYRQLVRVKRDKHLKFNKQFKTTF